MPKLCSVLFNYENKEKKLQKNIFSAQQNSMTKLCHALFKYEGKKNWFRKCVYNFV